MSAPDDAVARVAKEWIARAEDDWVTASHVLKLGKDCPTGSVCFHAQQCVEKYLKAVHVLNGREFPRTHDIEELFALLPVLQRPPLRIEDQGLLSTYAVSVRYPTDEKPASLSTAREAVKLARRVRTWARKLLPKVKSV